MPSCGHLRHHPECPTCTTSREAEDVELAEQHIKNSPVPLSERGKDAVRQAFMRNK